MKKLFLISALALISFYAAAQNDNQPKENEFSISAQLRARAEYRNGALFPRSEGTTPATFINNRARLSMEYKRSNLQMKFSAQHVGVWGQDAQIDKNGRFILNEAWAKLCGKQGFFAQIGRQGLVYDDDRLLGSLDWNVAGRYHDALKLGYEKNENKLHLILAFNQNDEKTIGGTYYASGAQPYKNMQTLWYNYASTATPLKISLLFINLGLEAGDAVTQKADTKYLQTFGTYVTYTPNKWNFSGTFYYQTGKNKAKSSVSAFMASLTAARKIAPKWTVSLGSDYLSGDDEGDKYNAFDPLYGTHHKFYGAMDCFYASSFVSGYNPGLWDNHFGVNFKTSETVLLQANYHYFLTAEKPLVNNEKMSSGLGSEIDLQLDWTIMKDVKLTAGYSTMFGTKTMDAVKGGSHKSWQDWGWISLNINPRLFSSKW